MTHQSEEQDREGRGNRERDPACFAVRDGDVEQAAEDRSCAEEATCPRGNLASESLPI
jgi:hypothetical protein